jgi:succinate dehydrogenase / fumarate reductase, cytochrome b subunit
MSQRHSIGFKAFSRRVVERLARGQPMGPGAYMYVVHRITALVITFYLYLHLYTLGSVLSGPGGFDAAMQLMTQPIVRLLELGLIWVVLFHALNGLRLTAVNLMPHLNQRYLAYGVVFISLGLALISLPLFLEV